MLVPALFGASGGRTLGDALADGYQRAMIVLAVISAVTALIAARFVIDAPADVPDQ